ncbi:MAG: glycerophosphodiester phosphodiesterase family protein [Acetobacteraceae bacterium]
MNANPRRCELHGHRGARGLWPENTLAGFRAALALGVDALEMDVGLSADGVVVVSHDPRLNPDLTRDAAGAFLDGPGPALRALPFAALRGYDVGRARPGSPVAAANPAQRAAEGERIPALAEVLALDPDVFLSIEIKTFPDQTELTASPEEIVAAVVAAAAAAGALGRIGIISFDARALRHAALLAPSVRRSFLSERETAAAAALWWGEECATLAPDAAAARCGAQAWGPDACELDAAAIARAHALGLLVLPWTVNDPEEMARLIGWGVDGLTTDRPDLAREVMAAHGLALPPARGGSTGG